MMDFIGAYRVVRELGHGGMGTVYEVEHAERGERLALKRFRAVWAAFAADRNFSVTVCDLYRIS